MKQSPRVLRSSRRGFAFVGGLRTLMAAASIAGVAACTGEIGPAGGNGSPTGPGSTVSGTTGGSGSSGTSTTSGVTTSGTSTGTTTGGGPAPGTDPGRVTMHRLNRVEYNNTVRDLLFIALTPANDFPVDDSGSGFDNMADVLSLSPVLLSLYQAAASNLVNEALANTAARGKLVTCDLVAQGANCARTVLTNLAPRAWRRAVTDAEITKMMDLVTLATSKGDKAEVGLGLAMQSMLLSPNFIFRVELDAAPTSLTPHPLGAYELASRLSYFLWSTMPDDSLFAAAKDGSLSQTSVLSAQVDRMLQSPKAQAIIDNFAGQWLYTRMMDDHSSEHTPDVTLFPKFDDKLRAAMKGETQLMFNDVVNGTLGADKFLTANYTYANDRLALHYGLPAMTSANLAKVSLAGNTQRGGFLAEGSFLTATSHTTRTSPVKRGKWILSQLLCTEIPPPPKDVDVQAIDKETTGTMRQRLEAHRANATCNACHGLMDPAGFGLENYDAIGAYRTMDNGAPVDASGKLGDKEFAGAQQLAGIVSQDPNFAPCLVKNLYTYALGRDPEDTPSHMDPAVIYGLAENLRTGGFNFRDLVGKIIAAATFTTRRGEAP